VLAAQERSIAHDIATAIQDVAAAWTAIQSNQNRFEAAAERVEIITFAYENGRRDATLDLVLRAQASAAQAENAYYQQVVAYNKAITALHLATGQLLTVNNIYLAEGRWCQDAYSDAELRAVERTHARDNEHLETAPHEFVSPGPPGTVELVRPEFENQSADVAPAETPPVPAAEQDRSDSTTGEPLAEPADFPGEPAAVPAKPAAVPAEPAAVPAEPREDLPAESSSGRSSARAAGPLAMPPYRLIPASHASAAVADEVLQPLFR
jgi:hypothetical protein